MDPRKETGGSVLSTSSGLVDHRRDWLQERKRHMERGVEGGATNKDSLSVCVRASLSLLLSPSPSLDRGRKGQVESCGPREALSLSITENTNWNVNKLIRCGSRWDRVDHVKRLIKECKKFPNAYFGAERGEGGGAGGIWEGLWRKGRKGRCCGSSDSDSSGGRCFSTRIDDEGERKEQ